MRKIYWRIRIILLALKWIPSLNLGDEVIYQGRRYTLIQGVYNPYWDLSRQEECLENIHRNNFKKVQSLPNYWHSFTSGYRFYMNAWYKIWLREGIKPWMRACNIWKSNTL